MVVLTLESIALGGSKSSARFRRLRHLRPARRSGRSRAYASSTDADAGGSVKDLRAFG